MQTKHNFNRKKQATTILRLMIKYLMKAGKIKTDWKKY